MPGSEHSLSETDLSGIPTEVFFGDVVYDPGGTYGPRWQPNYQLILIHSGHAAVEIDGLTHPLGKGEAALLKPGHRELFRFSAETRTRHSWCHFYWPQNEEVARKIERLGFGQTLSERLEHLVDLGLSLQHDPYGLGPARQHLAAAAFWEFVGGQASRLGSLRHATLPKPVTRVETYIFQHYAEEIALSKLSQIASVSPEHLNRLFRKHLGVTPAAYLWGVRTEQGAVSLRHTGLSVEETAYRCGFKTAAHFSRRIKARYGRTPSQIRACHWLNEESGRAP